MKAIRQVLSGACLLLLSVGMVQAQTIQGTDQKTALLELYTSEGCSSCPPADEWLTRLKRHDRLWIDFVPLAFHVTYWDYLGWKDPLGVASYTDRQRFYAAMWGSGTIYTPGFVLDGREWKSWYRYDHPPIRKERADVGTLSLEVLEERRYRLTFVPTIESKLWIGNVALIGFDIRSKVTAGENRGETLLHDFAVLSQQTLALNPAGSMSYLAEFELDVPIFDAPRYGVAAWVHQGEDLRPVQAIGGYLQQDQNK